MSADEPAVTDLPASHPSASTGSAGFGSLSAAGVESQSPGGLVDDLQALREVQTAIYTVTYPAQPGATDTELATVATELGVRLPRSYTDLLAVNGGQRNFFEESHLLSCADLLDGPLHRRSLQMLSLIEDEALADAQVGLGDLLPIAASESSLDVFALVVRGPLFGAVLWSTGAQGVPLAYFPSVTEWVAGLVADARSFFAAITG